jgi:hypothetical protein
MLPERVDFLAPERSPSSFFSSAGAVPPLSQALAQPYYVTLASRIVIYALAASSLNLISAMGDGHFRHAPISGWRLRSRHLVVPPGLSEDGSISWSRCAPLSSWR